ncbi:MAG: glutamate--tRNA ligase, partial [Alphaproteobacteria bacterium]
AQARLEKGMAGLAQRANTIPDIVDSASLYLFDAPLDFTDKATAALADAEARERLGELAEIFAGLGAWTEENLDAAVRNYAESRDIKLGQVAQPLRAALTGSNVSPGIFEVLSVLGREESLKRLQLVTE